MQPCEVFLRIKGVVEMVCGMRYRNFAKCNGKLILLEGQCNAETILDEQTIVSKNVTLQELRFFMDNYLQTLASRNPVMSDIVKIIIGEY
jgi:hypothetical protein